MFRSQVACIGWLLVFCASGLACTSVPPAHTEEGSARVARILGQELTTADLTRFAGRAPSICVTSTSITELCQWQLGNRYAGWAPLAEAIETRDQVNLICELPSDGSARDSRSCNAYPRRSNRGRFPIPTASATGRGRRTESPSQARARYRQQTNRALDAARTLRELAHLMGAVPNECSPRSSGLQVCLWRATNRTYGHGTLVMSIGAPKRKRVRMQCQLPTDGSDRAPDSCRVEVGG